MIRFDGVTFFYDEDVILDGFSLEIEEGKSTVLIGPSGCGKSTILRLVNGLLQPDAGSVVVNGTAVREENLRDIRLQTGYVIQEGGLFPTMTARRNITLMAGRLNRDAKKINERLHELCVLTHFDTELLDRFPAYLSGGQRQRVSLMRALMLDPPLLLLDEPFGALDPLVRAGLHDNMLDIFQQLKKTVLMVTHDMHEAAYLGDKIVLLKEGAVVQRGSAEQLVRQPANDFVRDFVRAQQSHLPGSDV